MFIKKIDIVLENCESLSVSELDIVRFDIGVVGERVFNYSNATTINKMLSSFELAIHKDAVPTDYFSSREISFDRLKECDVTVLEVHFSDDSSKLYYVDWPEGDEYRHRGQTFTTTPDGHILFTSTVSQTNSFSSVEAIDFAGTYATVKRGTNGIS